MTMAILLCSLVVAYLGLKSLNTPPPPIIRKEFNLAHAISDTISADQATV